jgi:hypothetical protein
MKIKAVGTPSVVRDDLYGNVGHKICEIFHLTVSEL